MKKYNELTEKEIEILRGKIESQEILSGRGISALRDEEDKNVLLVDFDGKLARISEDDFDYDVKWKSFAGFVGADVLFMVKEIDEESGMIYLSRKNAQLKNVDLVKESLENGEIFTATITGLLPHGAYVSMNDIYGMMRNSDFSDGYIRISDEMKVGDKIDVKLRSISKNGRISVQPVEKKKVDGLLNIDMFQESQVVEGTVRAIRSFGGVYVMIAPGVDVLCNIPEVEEIEEGMNVKIKIKKIWNEERKDGTTLKRVKGKILSVLLY